MPETLQLVTLINSKLAINPHVLQIFQQYTSPFAIVGICGEYRTGKSFLLNTLFAKNNTFEVSPTTQPCTQGINILQTPLTAIDDQESELNIWVLDTEGFGSLNKDSFYDSKIFLLILLLSDILIYNSKGALDEQTISKLALTCQEATSIVIDDRALRSSINSKLFWVLRDFALSLRDQDSQEITPDQYLQRSLSMHSDSQNNHALLQRKVIKTIFQDRNCIPLVRPYFSEQSLSSKCQSNQPIRLQFLEGIKELKQRIFTKIRSKKQKKQKMNGPTFMILLQKLINAINETNFSGGLTISWQQITQVEQERKSEEALAKVHQIINKYEQKYPLELNQMKQIKEDIQNQTIKYLEMIQSNKIREILQKEIEHKIQALSEINKETMKFEVKQFVKQQTKQLEHKLISLSTLGNFHQKIKGQFQRIRQNCKIKFQSHYLNQHFKNQIQFYIQSILTHFWETLSCDLVKKWAQDADRSEHGYDELKQKNFELSQQIKQMNMSSHQANTKQLSRLKAKNEEMMRTMKNYNEVIDRMENVNEHLKRQLQIIMNSEQYKSEGFERQRDELQQKVLNLESKVCQLVEQNNLLKFEVKECSDLQNISKNTINSLKERLKNMGREHDEEIQKFQRQILDKNQTMLQILQNQRTKYLQMMAQWRNQQEHLKEELAERDALLDKIRVQSQNSNNQMQEEINQIIKQTKQDSQKILALKKKQLEDAIKQKQAIQQEHGPRLKQKQLQIQSLLQQNQILKRQNSIYEKKYKNLDQQQQNQVQKLNNKIHVITQELKNKQQKISHLEQQATQFNQCHQQQINNLTQKLCETNQKYEYNHKQKQSYLRKQFDVEKGQIVSKLNEAAARIEKLKNKNEALSNDVEVYRSENGKIRKQIKQMEMKFRDCENCFENEMMNKKLQEEVKKVKSEVEQLRFECEDKENQILNLRTIINDGNNQNEELNTPECPQQSKVSVKRIFQYDYLENFGRSPKLQNNDLNKQMAEEKEKMHQIYQKKQEKHKQVVEMYKKKIQNLIQTNQELREQLENKNQIYLQSTLQRKEKICTNLQNIFKPHLAHQSATDYDSLTSQLKTKITQLATQNKKLRSQVEEERNKNNQLQRDSVKIVNLHALMKKSRIQEVQNILKQNSQLKYQIENLKEKQKISNDTSDAHSRIAELLTMNNQMVEEIESFKNKYRNLEKMFKQEKQKCQQFDELVKIQKQELTKLVTHYEEKVICLKSSKEQVRMQFERQNSLLRKERDQAKYDYELIFKNHEKLMNKRQQELCQKVISTQSKNYKERLNKLFI